MAATNAYQAISFTWPYGGEKGFIAGSFNRWEQIPMIKTDHGFELVLALPVGKYEYKFVIDGNWVHDISKPNETNGINTNNVIEVKEKLLTTTTTSDDSEKVKELERIIHEKDEQIKRLNSDLEWAQGEVVGFKSSLAYQEVANLQAEIERLKKSEARLKAKSEKDQQDRASDRQIMELLQRDLATQKEKNHSLKKIAEGKVAAERAAAEASIEIENLRKEISILKKGSSYSGKDSEKLNDIIKEKDLEITRLHDKLKKAEDDLAAKSESKKEKEPHKDQHAGVVAHVAKEHHDTQETHKSQNGSNGSDHKKSTTSST